MHRTLTCPAGFDKSAVISSHRILVKSLWLGIYQIRRDSCEAASASNIPGKLSFLLDCKGPEKSERSVIHTVGLQEMSYNNPEFFLQLQILFEITLKMVVSLVNSLVEACVFSQAGG